MLFLRLQGKHLLVLSKKYANSMWEISLLIAGFSRDFDDNRNFKQNFIIVNNNRVKPG